VVISATVPVDSVQQDLSALADWTTVNDDAGDPDYYEATWNDFSDTAKWSKTQEQRTRKETQDDGSEKTITYQALVLKTIVDSKGCDEKTVNNVKVCVKTGHELSFECSYSLEDQSLDAADFTVSGSDFADSTTGVGKLTYTLAMDGSSALKIGDVAKATITPKTAGLVHASINECNVSHDHDGISTNDDQSVSIINPGLYPVCPLTAVVETGKGTGVLSFSWKSFKWTTEKNGGNDVQEDQKLTCSISLAAAAQGQVNKNWEDLCDQDCNKGAFVDLEEVSDITTLDACKKRCEDRSGCGAVTFVATKNKCWLKDTCAGTTAGFGATGISAKIV